MERQERLERLVTQLAEQTETAKRFSQVPPREATKDPVESAEWQHQEGRRLDNLSRAVEARDRTQRAILMLESGWDGNCRNPGCRDEIEEARLVAKPDSFFCKECAEMTPEERRTVKKENRFRSTRSGRPSQKVY